jgi:hypothetical protein
LGLAIGLILLVSGVPGEFAQVSSRGPVASPVEHARTVEGLAARANQEWLDLRVELDAGIRCVSGDGRVSQSEITIRRDGAARTRIDFRSPPRDAGKVLVRIGADTWVYLPRAGKRMKLPPRRDPVPGGEFLDSLLPGESGWSGAQRTETDHGIVLEWAATRRTDEGGRIVFDRETLLPIRRDFVSSKGRTLRSLIVDDTREWSGSNIPWSIRFVDHTGSTRECAVEVTRAAPLVDDVDTLFAMDEWPRSDAP